MILIQIKQFCRFLPHPHYLGLFISADSSRYLRTKSYLWNAWKDSLLKELYRAAKAQTDKEQELMDETALINVRKQYALSSLDLEGMVMQNG